MLSPSPAISFPKPAVRLHRRPVLVLGAALAALACVALPAPAHAADEPVLRVLTHSSFALKKSLIAQFERDHKVKISLIKAGDAGEMLNKLILTRQAPIADVVFGIDNGLLSKARFEKVLAPLPQPLDADGARFKAFDLGPDLAPIDYGYVNLNADRAPLAKAGLAAPKTLQDLTKPAWKNRLVVQNPATSSTGLAFFLATQQALGGQVWDFWKALKANGVMVTPGWTQAYQKEFTLNGGQRPLVLSYSTSPAAEVFYSEGKYTAPPTDNVMLPGGVWLQVEGAGLVQGGKQPQLGLEFIRFLRSADVQADIPTQMWVYPVREGVALDPVLQATPLPAGLPSTVSIPADAQKLQADLRQWARLMRP
ncbi:thiamine ABC transporter substrate-binding protein [Amphibiibacter pelophylacis]|uniref:Thiamine ABC transporter substrate-binding protein n=1 Tax=Amphibiibacter pelophylacis TaxID=1799477 RepID=A0ACC6P2S7_9BURK